MKDYNEIIEALRCCASGTCDSEKCDYMRMCAYGCMIGLAQDAADAIEALQAEADKANKSADAYRAMYFAKHGYITIEKVRELGEMDSHFHSALIRIMNKRIEELESAEKSRKENCEECTAATRKVIIDLQGIIADLRAQMPKRGEWKKGVHSVVCPICGSSYEFADDVFVEDLDMDEDLDMRYCPKCGSDNVAKMEVQDGESNS